MKKYYMEINILRGVAILLVLLGHSIILFPINLMNVTWCMYLYRYIYFFHMPLFFMISGFCYNYKGVYKIYVESKFRRILIPYMVFSIFDLIPRHLFPQLINRNESFYYDIKGIIFSGGQYWFLYVLFIVFIIFPVIEKIFKNKVYAIIGMLALIIISSFEITDLFLINRVLIYLIYFIIGYLIRNVYTNNFKYIMSKASMVLLTIILFIASSLLPKNHITDIINALTGSLMAYSIVLFIKNKVMNNILDEFGKFSLQLYLLNGFMLVPARAVTIKLLHISNPLVIILLIFISNAIIGIIIAKYFINKFNITKFLSGIKTEVEKIL